ncbi:MAG TPA: rod shape-determining protein MreD [Geobacteraceae bacterium]|nr:rod shape-determining protein MreD [Geobacteraceae bacterium]
MTARIKVLFFIILSLILQVAFFPTHFPDSFKPNLMIMFIVYLSFMEDSRWGGVCALLLGLVQDSLSGIYFGLNAFSYLLIFIILKAVSHRLYTDSRSVMVLAVFLMTVINGLASLALLTVFFIAPGLYSTILSNVFTQGFINAFVAFLSFKIFPLRKREDLV